MRRLFGFLLTLGPGGPFLLGIADSSFLFLPFGNDLLLVILVARAHQRFAPYVLAAALGSTLGLFLIDAVCRKGGEEGLKKLLKPKRFAYLKRKMAKRAGIAVAIACIAPPPFPFTAVAAAASAFEYPRPKLLTIGFAMRALRFSLVGLAAVLHGQQILEVARSRGFRWAMYFFIALYGVGSAISVAGWVRRSRRAA